MNKLQHCDVMSTTMALALSSILDRLPLEEPKKENQGSAFTAAYRTTSLIKMTANSLLKVRGLKDDEAEIVHDLIEGCELAMQYIRVVTDPGWSFDRHSIRDTRSAIYRLHSLSHDLFLMVWDRAPHKVRMTSMR